MKGLIIVYALLCLVAIYLPLTTGQFCNGPKRGYINDTTENGQDDVLTVGFLFPFHGRGDSDGICSQDIPNLDNIQLLEMARYSLLFANIPGVRIALEAFDSCYSDHVAIEQSVRYLNDRISVTGGSQTCLDGSFKPGVIMHGTESVGPSIGAFLTDAQVPIVSYAATQSQLTADEEYSYFSRILPSDKDEAIAIADILKSLGWTYVSVIYSDGQDDTSAMESFKKAAARSNICISQSASFALNANEGTVATTMVNLVTGSAGGQETPNVVIIFASPLQASWIVSQASRQTAIAGTIQWVVGQHVLSDTTALDALPASNTRGLIGVISDELAQGPQSSFDAWFKSLTPNGVSSSQNPWFKDFWQTAYKCNLPGSTQYSVPCGSTHEAMHSNSFKLNPYTNLISKAIMNFEIGLNNAQKAMCGSGTTGACDAFRNMQSAELLNYIQGVGYKANGDPAMVKFAIQNYKSGTKTKVGSWEEGAVGLALNPTDLELWSSAGMVPVTSVCGEGCTDEKCYQSINVTRVYRTGDIILGGMFSVHKPAEGQCGDINEQGIQRLEAMLFALDKINQDNSLLPGITLGVEGFDTCGTPDIAGHLALQLSASGEFGNSGSGERFRPDGLPEHIYAIIGPETNEECAIVSPITNVYELPVMGYAADSPILSNLYTYPNFARVIAPSHTQAQAMVELIFRQGWKYMNVLYSDTKYGLYGANTLEAIGTSRLVCTSNKIKIPAEATTVDWDQVFNTLDQHSEAKLLVLFLEDFDLANLFQQLTEHGRVGLYFIVVSDRWMFRRSDLVIRYPDLMRGISVVTTPLRDFTEFRTHFASLRPNTNVRNPWFTEFWEDKFQCSLDGAVGIPCNGNNGVNADDLTDRYLAETIDTVYAVARALNYLQLQHCLGQNGVCAEMTATSGSDFYNLIKGQRFNSVNQDEYVVSFNNLGDGTPVYDVFNYQSDVNGGNFEFVKIGHFVSYSYQDNFDNNRLKVYDTQGREIDSPQSVCSGQCHDCQKPNDKGDTAEIRDGDVWLGGFFRLHNIGPDKLTCTDELVLYNMQLLEAFLFAIDSINDDPSILPHIKLGAIGFDTCGSPSRAQREAANFVTAAVEYRNGYFSNRLTVSGIIGEETSDTTLALAETVTPLKVSQISYAATTSKLDDQEKYPYFMRTVASNQKQAAALVGVMDNFNWKYISVVYSDNEFGNDMFENVKKLIAEKNICFALALKASSNFTAMDFNTIVKELQLNPQAKVVLLLTSDIHTKALLTEAENLGVYDLQWVGGDTWGARPDIIQQSPLTASGAIVLQFRSQPVPGFREYFTSRPTYTNLRNPWWKRYLSDYFQCNLPTVDVPAKYDHQCPNNLDLDSVFEEAAEVQSLVRAVNMFVVGLQFAMTELCPEVTSYVCQEVLENPEALQRNIQSAGFQLLDGSTFLFDDLGNGPANYDIFNVQRPREDKVAYIKVGTWDAGNLNLNLGDVKSYRGQREVSLVTTQCQGRCSECRLEADTNIQFVQVPGQIQIPGLFAVHESGDHLVECGDVRESGVMNLEAFLYALELINNDANLLPNVRVGTTSFDTCMSGARGVRELSGLLSGTATFNKEQKLSGAFSTVVGVVGAESDAVTMDTGALTGRYKYAQVSYGASSENTRNDQYLLQAGPSHSIQAEAVVALIKNYGWKYISVIRGEGDEFYQGAFDFLQATRSTDICIATNEVLQSGQTNQVINELMNNGAKVVIIFAASSDIKKLLTNIGTNAPHLTWILAFPDSIEPSDLLPRSADAEVLRGALVLSSTEEVPYAFQQHLSQLTLENNLRNPWFAETTGSFSQAAISEFGPKAANIIDATYAIAHGIHNMMERLCPGGMVCTEFLIAEPQEFYDEIAKASFIGINLNQVEFLDGTLVQRYRISNYQNTGNSFSMVEVGSWKSGDDTPMLQNSVRLFDGVEDVDNIDSNCPSVDACTMCILPPTGLPDRPPRPTDYPGKVTKQPPNPNQGKLSGTASSDLGSLWFIVLVAVSAIGIIVSAVIICLLIWRWDEPITRTISPFLCLVILIGIILLYGVTPILAAPVSKILCAIQRVYPGVAWCVCFSGVFLQVMRHWRIARRERRISGAKVSFVNNTSQVVLFLFLLGFQVILGVDWLIIQPPGIVASSLPETSSNSNDPIALFQATLDCAYTKESMITYCIFIFALLALSFLISIVARRYGHVISIVELNTLLLCNFLNVLIMVGWVVVEIFVEGDVHRPATSAAAALTATVTLIVLFSYRVRVLFRNHDPFVDTASVASGEYFSGTMGRQPQTRMSVNMEHIYDAPPSEANHGNAGRNTGSAQNGSGYNGSAHNGSGYNGSAHNGGTSSFNSRSSLEKPKLGKDTTGF